MSKTSLTGTKLILVLALTGCYKTVGPVVTSVRLDKNGAIHYSRCNLVIGSTLGGPDVAFENCVNESHDALDAPNPLPQHASSKHKDED